MCIYINIYIYIYIYIYILYIYIYIYICVYICVSVCLYIFYKRTFTWVEFWDPFTASCTFDTLDFVAVSKTVC